MSREASERTLAVRALCEESNGEITYGDARELLEKAGHHVPPQPDSKSDELKRLAEYDIDYSAEDVVDVVAATLGISAKDAKKVVAEANSHIEFEKDRAYFNVTKNQWKKSAGLISGNGGRGRPAGSGKKGKRRQTVATATVTDANLDDALAYAESVGGLSNVQEELSNAQAEVARLQSIVETLQAHVERVERVAA